MRKTIKTILMMLALTPLIVDNSVFNPFITGKTFFLRLIVVITGLLTLTGLLFIKRFGEDITGKIKLLTKSPIFLAISSFILISIISAIFAVDKYIAFWGDVTRAEGLVGLLFFFTIFLLTALFFEKKDWLNFFQLSLLVSLAVLIKEFFQYFSGISRPESFMGNPTFLAGYLLFSIFSSIIVFKESNSKFWKYFGILTIVLSILGIFIAQTRGTILGLGLGLVVVLVYIIFKYKSNLNTATVANRKVANKNTKNIKNSIKKDFNYRKLAIITLSLIILLSIFFAVTRKNEIWQKVPGISRIAKISLEDSTTSTRLINVDTGLKSINPTNNGLGKLLVGWGPDNFSLAYGKYFDKNQFDFEKSWFDRAHNKIIDLAVMTGMLGLLSYLSIYTILFLLILRKKEFSLINAGLLFILTAFFVHLLFVFDVVVTSVYFFMILAFSFYSMSIKGEDIKMAESKENNTIKYISLSVFTSLIIFLVILFFRGDLISYIQMRKYSSLRKSGYVNYESKINEVFFPFTVAQIEIRKNLMSFVKDNFNKSNMDMVKLGDIATEKGEDYVNRNPKDFRFLVFLASDYTFKGNKLKNTEFLLKGEKYYRQMIEQVPYRPDAICGLALNLYYQGKYDEAFVNFEKSFDISPKFYQKEGDNVESIYTFFMQYFYEKRDKGNFIKVADRLKENKYANSALLDQVIEYMNKYNKWPNIDFNHK